MTSDCAEKAVHMSTIVKATAEIESSNFLVGTIEEIRNSRVYFAGKLGRHVEENNTTRGNGRLVFDMVHKQRWSFSYYMGKKSSEWIRRR